MQIYQRTRTRPPLIRRHSRAYFQVETFPKRSVLPAALNLLPREKQSDGEQSKNILNIENGYLRLTSKIALAGGFLSIPGTVSNVLL